VVCHASAAQMIIRSYPKKQCVDAGHIKNGNINTTKLGGGCCLCCHTNKCNDLPLGQYPELSTANQFFTPTQNAAFHVAGTFAAKKAIGMTILKESGSPTLGATITSASFITIATSYPTITSPATTSCTPTSIPQATTTTSSTPTMIPKLFVTE